MAVNAADDDDFAEDGQQAEPGKSGRLKLIVAAGGLVVLLAVGGAGAWFAGLIGGSSDPETTAAAEKAAPPPKPAYFYALPEITVNLSSAETRASYLRVNISLEFSDESMIKQVQPNLPRVLDAFQVYLRELRIDDLNGSAGLFRLKEELQRRINIAIYPAKVDDILFKDLKVQ